MELQSPSRQIGTSAAVVELQASACQVCLSEAFMEAQAPSWQSLPFHIPSAQWQCNDDDVPACIYKHLTPTIEDLNTPLFLICWKYNKTICNVVFSADLCHSLAIIYLISSKKICQFFIMFMKMCKGCVRL